MEEVTNDSVEVKKDRHILKSFKKTLLVLLLALSGILLTLAGLNLISITTNLQLYSGLGLLVLAALYYLIY